jgi:hypothetical protein
MSTFNARLQLFRTDDEIPIGTLIFNFDSDKEIQEFKDLVIEAHQDIVTRPGDQLPEISIMNNTDARDRNAAVGITGDELGDAVLNNPQVTDAINRFYTEAG